MCAKRVTPAAKDPVKFARRVATDFRKADTSADKKLVQKVVAKDMKRKK